MAVDDVEVARQKSLNKLKSAFESLFEKYDKPFEEEADEVDLFNLHVVQDNGFLKNLQWTENVFDGRESETESAENDEDDDCNLSEVGEAEIVYQRHPLIEQMLNDQNLSDFDRLFLEYLENEEEEFKPLATILDYYYVAPPKHCYQSDCFDCLFLSLESVL